MDVWPLLLKLLKFGVVGASGVVIDFGITYLLKEKLKANKYLANTTGFLIAASSNYLFNRLWTFQSQDPHIAGQYIRFIVIACGGVVISNTIIYLLHERLKQNFYIVKFIAIGIVMLWNFFGSVFFAFK